MKFNGPTHIAYFVINAKSNVLSWPSGSGRRVEWTGHGTEPGLVSFSLLSYLVIADYLLCQSAHPAEVRNRLKLGFRLLVKQIAVDRSIGTFRCTWTVSLEDSEECKFNGGFFSLFFRAFLSRGFASALSRAGALPQRSQEPGLCLSALKSRGFASALSRAGALPRRSSPTSRKGDESMPNFFSLRLLSLDSKIQTRVRYENRKVYISLNFQVSSGFKSPSKATHYEWLDTTRTTFRIGK
uniref:Ig-like domain-containing protein n=1 Tax=Heterorhabditis bacteriophora TaxID=37862 RepID=A0A1I7X0U4_HETBA